MALSGKIKDIDNPIFIFRTVPTKLLKDLLSGKYNITDLIQLELDERK